MMMDDTERIALLRSALQRLGNAVERVGGNERYWPRDMRLDGTCREVEAALDEAGQTLDLTGDDDG